MKTLKDVKAGETAVIKKLHGEGALKYRIMDMGINEGTQVLVKKSAPLGDPVMVRVRECDIFLRKSDMKKIEVE